MSDDLASDVRRRIFAKPLGYFRTLHEWPGPLAVTPEEYMACECAVRDNREYRGLSPNCLMGQAPDGTVGLLFHGVVLVIDRAASEAA